jgi:hypothetical protein
MKTALLKMHPEPANEIRQMEDVRRAGQCKQITAQRLRLFSTH